MKSERIDRIELMNTFIRIIESGSLSAAAVQMNTTQATVSRRLKSLEALLGSKLLLRTTHAMKLTDDGERCYQHAKTVTGHWMMLEDDVRNAEDEPVGTLRIRAPHAFGQEQLIAPLTQFLQQYPRMNVEWLLNDKAPLFISENIDCAIHVGAQPDPSTISVLLAEVPRIVVASPGLLQHYPPAHKPEDLASLPWVALSTFYQQEVVLKRTANGESRAFAIAPRLSTDSLYAVRETVLAGLGVGIVSAWIVASDLAQGRLVQVLPQWQAAPLPVWLVYPYSRYYPARLRKFLDLMREIMPGLMGMQPPEKAKKSRS
ncbi:LysR family transcriptional activator ttdR [Atlantibacter hermannii NBRC 105704]|uniref:LysR family transcriptional activator ttdR n=3 Tax=Atlantibacter hermannii TaxID=565 RepID=H5V174_ATLHE|nr:LysR family transcriptional activator ttdR [Atlantibacter hermannii NBRC 105704]VDZ74008.1 putative LysR-family transcriptional regulator [Atlantibacter hermannii]